MSLQQPASQVEDTTVTHPRVPMKGDGAEGGQIIQEPVREGGQLVVVEMQLGGPSRETGGQVRGGEKLVAAVHPTASTHTELGAR